MSYYVDDTGVWYRKTPDKPPVLLSKPIKVHELTEQDGCWGRLLEFQRYFDGKTVSWFMPARMLSPGGRAIQRELLDRGFGLVKIGVHLLCYLNGGR